MTPPPAGSWIRSESLSTALADRQWHRFTGDLTWHPAWPAPSLDAACGYTTSPDLDIGTIETVDETPDQPCRRCLALAGRPEAAR